MKSYIKFIHVITSLLFFIAALIAFIKGFFDEGISILMVGLLGEISNDVQDIKDKTK